MLYSKEVDLVQTYLPPLLPMNREESLRIFEAHFKYPGTIKSGQFNNCIVYKTMPGHSEAAARHAGSIIDHFHLHLTASPTTFKSLDSIVIS